jgi:hypothetical protein
MAMIPAAALVEEEVVAAVAEEEEARVVVGETVDRRAVACVQFKGFPGLLVKAGRSPYGWSPAKTPTRPTT